MIPYKRDLFLMGHRNMMCIVRKHGKEFNTFLYSYIGINNVAVVKMLQLFFPLLFILNVIWAFLLTIAKFLISLVKVFGKKPYVYRRFDELYLNFTYMFMERTKAAGLYQNSKYWVIGPNIDKAFIPKDKELIDYRQAISLIDNFNILSRSFNTIWNYMCHERSLCLVHKVWQFYEVQIGLSKIASNSKIYFANQSDKYASLFDSISTGPKVLLQHGIALNWDVLPCPLEHIDIFYAISSQTWQDAYANILVGQPELKFFNPTIQLIDYKNKRKSVLIVSEVTYFEQEVKILKALRGQNVDVYLKRHPGFVQDECYRNLQQEFDFTYITEKIFPKVDFVISYFSTLAYEYMAYDIPVYIYNTAEDFNVEIMLSEMNKKIL